MTAHQQARKPHRPEAEVSLRQPANRRLEVIGHVVVVVAFVPERAQEVEHPRAGVLALLAETVSEIARQHLEKVHFGAHDGGADGLEGEQG